MAAPTTTYRMWKRLAERPGGSRLFSVAAMARVPYFASIVPHVVRMEPGSEDWGRGHGAEVVLRLQPPAYRARDRVVQCRGDRDGHADGGHGADQPPMDPKAMTVQYLEKATSSLRAQARLEPPDFASITDGTELTVPVSVLDRTGTEVVHADITCWVTQAAV